MQVGTVPLGSDAPVSVQTMTKRPADDVEGTLAQIRAAADAECDIIRCAVPSVKHVDALEAIIRQSPLPVVADIHFDARIALGAIHAGAAKIRINPGNMGDQDALKAVVDAARNAGIPIRIGVNSGSIKHNSGEADSRPLEQALIDEALSYAEQFENWGFSDIVLSLKATGPVETIRINRAVAAQCDFPLHLGVTEAGPENIATLKSAVGIGSLLADGIGDTIRLSFTGEPVREVVVGQNLLRAIGLRQDRVNLVSCPTCGRCTVDLPALVQDVQKRLDNIHTSLTVAVMGCEVNGPGEAKAADVGLAAGGGQITLFANGETLRRVPAGEAVDALLQEIERIMTTQKGKDAS